MKKQQILIVSKTIGESPGMVSTFREEPDWQISLVSSAEDAITLFYAKPFDAVIIGKNMHFTDEQKIRAVLNHCSFESIIQREDNDDPEELKNAILCLINARRADELKHIHVNDTLNVNNLADSIKVTLPGQGEAICNSNAV